MACGYFRIASGTMASRITAKQTRLHCRTGESERMLRTYSAFTVRSGDGLSQCHRRVALSAEWVVP